MSTTIGIKDSVYAKRLAKSLPRAIPTDAEHARFAQTPRTAAWRKACGRGPRVEYLRIW